MGPIEFTEWGNVIAMIATAVWAVTRIKSTTERLAISLDHLKETVVKLDVRFGAVQQELALLRDRITKVETIVQLTKTNGHNGHDHN